MTAAYTGTPLLPPVADGRSLAHPKAQAGQPATPSPRRLLEFPCLLALLLLPLLLPLLAFVLLLAAGLGTFGRFFASFSPSS